LYPADIYLDRMADIAAFVGDGRAYR
jgi:hypothetical protein